MPHAAHLMLDREQHAPGSEIDDVLEAVLVLAALLGDEAELLQAPVGAGEIRHVDLHVMAVKGTFRGVGLAKDEILPGPDHDARAPYVAVVDEICRRSTQLA